MQAPGWYPNPNGGLAYFDGYRWTGHTMPVPPGLEPDKLTHPAVGWVLAVAGALVAIAAFMPWVTALGGAISRNGLDGGSDGLITLVLGVAIAGIGVAIGMRQGLIWAPIVATLLAVLAGVVFAVDYNDVSGRELLDVGSGLWLTGVASIIAFISALVGFAVRD